MFLNLFWAWCVVWDLLSCFILSDIFYFSDSFILQGKKQNSGFICENKLNCEEVYSFLLHCNAKYVFFEDAMKGIIYFNKDTKIRNV